VVNVGEVQLGSELDVAVSAGATAITVSDLEAMDWGTDRQLQIGPDAGPQEIVAYSIPAAEDPSSDEIDLDETPDAEGGTVDLGAALLNAYAVDTPVRLYPPTYERMVYCIPEGQYEEIAARVPDKLLTRLLTRTRDDATSETVEIEIRDDAWVVADVVGDYPATDASYIIPFTLPTAVGPNSPSSGSDVATFFAEAWTAPGNVATSDDTYAHAVGTGISDPPTPGNTGFKYPADAEDDPAVGSQNWGAMSAALGAPDDMGASADAPSGLNTHYLKLTDFGFNVPVGATITGVQATIIRRNGSSSGFGGSGGGGAVMDNLVKLVKGGSIVGTDHSNLVHWPADFTGISYGGTADMWGTTLTDTDVNASDFGIAISADEDAGGQARIDAVRLKVSYTTPAVTARSKTHFLSATDFGFAIPDDALITGITAVIERHASANAGDDYAVDNDVRLLKGASTPTATDNNASDKKWPTSDTAAIYGGDLWGTTWSPDEINDPAFGVLISADVNNGVTAYVDHIGVTVYYVEAS
jgi:hypothetical protein